MWNLYSLEKKKNHEKTKQTKTIFSNYVMFQFKWISLRKNWYFFPWQHSTLKKNIHSTDNVL